MYAELPTAETSLSATRSGSDQAEFHTPVLRLKSFRDIPLADVEVVLPGLKAERMKSADVVKLVVILLAGIATAVYSFLSSRAETRSGQYVLIYSTLFGLLALRAFQTWRSVVNSKYEMNEFIRTTLYHRSQDSQRGVLLSIINSIAQHELRETITAYLLMRSHGRQLGVATHGVNATARKQGDGAISDTPDAGACSGLIDACVSCGSLPYEAVGEGNHEVACSRVLSTSEVASAAACALDDGSVSLAESEQLCLDFFRTEFSALVDVHVEDALARLERLGLVGKTNGFQHTNRHHACSTAKQSGEHEPARPDFQNYVAVPIPAAVTSLRSIWGTKLGAGNGPEHTCAGRNAPTLLMLTAPTSMGSSQLRNRMLIHEEHSPADGARGSMSFRSHLKPKD